MGDVIERIHTTPDAYAHVLVPPAIRHGELLFVSGQTAYGEDGRFAGGTFREQGERTFRNLQRVLMAGGSGLEHVLKVTIFVTDMAHFLNVVALRRRYFTAPFPADSIVEVSGLYAPDVMIEIEAIAVVAGKPSEPPASPER